MYITSRINKTSSSFSRVINLYSRSSCCDFIIFFDGNSTYLLFSVISTKKVKKIMNKYMNANFKIYFIENIMNKDNI